MPTLEFKGKQHIYAHHLTVPYRPLEPDESKSCNPIDTDDNLIIHGDNLHALKALLPRCANRIKCIYIDPPYNTGNGEWEYNDNVNSPLMQAWFDQHSPVDSEDLERHDKWLCMMWPRLHLLKELLTEDGTIFISIDHNEQHHLRMLMDEIFGEQNIVANFTWWSKYTLSNDSKTVSYQHENILSYAKNLEVCQIGVLPRTPEMDKSYKNPDEDPKGPWKATPLHAKSGRDEDRYSLKFPNGVTWHCPEGRFPRYTEKGLTELYNDGQLYFGRSGKSQPNKKTYLSEVKAGKTVGSLWPYQEVGSTHQANEELASVMGKGVFNNPKGTKLIQRVFQTANLSSDDIVLDSFAGSGTTAHAVLALNKEDDGNRKFILIECEDYADTITAERIRRVINGVPEARDDALREGLGGSFTYCNLGKPIEVESMLTGEALPAYAALAANLLYTTSGVSVGADTLEAQNDDGLFHSDDKNDYYLIYKPDLEYLRGNAAILNLERAERIRDTSRENDRKAIVYAAGNYIGQRELTQMGIIFCQLPDALHER
ncbi:MAG: site-specific DNA-methyltransferase [Candidatus Poribacteria bacterium]|nr:site-specific DNA-methyltransferase [Candidatus Poribacteria bacterium]